MIINTIISLIIAAEIAIVLIIIITVWKLKQSLQTDDFNIIMFSWVANFLYLSFGLTVSVIKQFNYIPTIFVTQLTSFFDITQFALLYLALVRTEFDFKLKRYIRRLNYLWIPIGLFVFSVGFYWEVKDLNIVPYFNIHYIPSIIFNSFALFLSGHLLKNIALKYNVSYQSIFYGAFLYGCIQILAIIDPEDIEKNNAAILLVVAWSLGLVSKFLICWGLLLIFKEEASKSRRLEKILKDVFHELKNNLHGINLPVQKILVSRNSKNVSEAQEIEKSYEIIASIIDATWIMYKNDLDNKVENNEDSLFAEFSNNHKEYISLNTLIEISVKLSKKLFLKKVAFDYDFGGGCEIKCFKHEIIQILTNLIKNSVEAMNGQKGRITIITRKKYYDETNTEIKCVNIEFIDDGPGIPLEIQPNIFKHGFTTKPNSHGRGVGLALTKEIIERNYGRIEVHSPVFMNDDIQFGTKFIIYFNKIV